MSESLDSRPFTLNVVFLASRRTDDVACQLAHRFLSWDYGSEYRPAPTVILSLLWCGWSVNCGKDRDLMT